MSPPTDGENNSINSGLNCRQRELIDQIPHELTGADGDFITDNSRIINHDDMRILQSILSIAQNTRNDISFRSDRIKKLAEDAAAAKALLGEIVKERPTLAVKRNLEKFQDQKPQDVRREALECAKNFLTRNPSILPDLATSLSGFALQSREAIDGARKEIENIEQENSRLRAKNARYNSMTNSWKTEFSKQENDIRHLDTRMGIAEKHYHDLSADQVKKQDEHRDVISRLQLQNDQLRAKLEVVEESVRSKSQTIAEMDQTLEGVQHLSQDTSRKLLDKERLLDDIQLLLEASDSSFRRVTFKDDELTLQLEKLNGTLVDEINKKKANQDDLKKKKEDVKILEANIAKIQTDLNEETRSKGVYKGIATSALKGQNEEIRYSLESLAKYREASAKVTTLEVQCNSASTRVNELEAQVGTLSTRLDELEGQRQTSEGRLQSMKADLTNVKHALDPSQEYATAIEAAQGLMQTLSAVKAEVDPTNSSPDVLASARAISERVKATQLTLSVVKFELDPAHSSPDVLAAARAMSEHVLTLRQTISSVKSILDPDQKFPDEVSAASSVQQKRLELHQRMSAVKEKVDPRGRYSSELAAVTSLQERLAEIRMKLDPTQAFQNEILAADDLLRRRSKLEERVLGVKSKLDPENAFQDETTAAKAVCDDAENLRIQLQGYTTRWPFYHGALESLVYDTCKLEGWTMRHLEQSWCYTSELYPILMMEEILTAPANFQIIHGLTSKATLRRSPWEEVILLLGRLESPSYRLRLADVEAIGTGMQDGDPSNVRSILLLLFTFLAARIKRLGATDKPQSHGTSLVLLRMFEIITTHVTSGKAMEIIREKFAALRPHLRMDLPLIRILERSVTLRLLDSKWKVFDLKVKEILPQQVADSQDLSMTMIQENLLLWKSDQHDLAILRPGQFKLETDISLGFRVCFQNAPMIGSCSTEYWPWVDGMKFVHVVFGAHLMPKDIPASQANQYAEEQFIDSLC